MCHPLVASIHLLRVVFRNVLDNAIKYTPAGGAITWQRQVEDGHLHTTISDTGRGIAPEDLPHLFERFYRADQARTREMPGVGLGLSLVQEVVRAYSGRATIDSDGVDQGSTVDVWWPLPTAAEMARDTGSFLIITDRHAEPIGT